MFEHRYGSPSSATTDYQEFAKWFLSTFSGLVSQILKHINNICICCCCVRWWL